jgi:hypothetical protein
MDAHKREIIRIDRLATGGKGDSLTAKTHAPRVLDHCQSAEYVPEMVSGGIRQDVKPINITQPEGPSFTVTDESLVEWQKWRFRVSFNPREGAVLHDVTYDNRSILYRMSISEMTVPYADARPPFHRKQAFDFGDGGAGNCANNLSLGCDCLGAIKYFDSVVVGSNGEPTVHPNVVCLHEQDNGIGWKHTNWRTGRAVVTRMRELVVQFIITLANYEYVFAYKLDTAGGITLEVRATGIVSVVNIDPGKTSDYGNVVSGGVLAQNHQHIFAAREFPPFPLPPPGDSTTNKHPPRRRPRDRRPQQQHSLRRIAHRALGQTHQPERQPIHDPQNPDPQIHRPRRQPDRKPRLQNHKPLLDKPDKRPPGILQIRAPGNPKTPRVTRLHPGTARPLHAAPRLGDALPRRRAVRRGAVHAAVAAGAGWRVRHGRAARRCR